MTLPRPRGPLSAHCLHLVTEPDAASGPAGTVGPAEVWSGDVQLALWLVQRTAFDGLGDRATAAQRGPAVGELSLALGDLLLEELRREFGR